MKDLHKPANLPPARPSRHKTVLDYVEEKRRKQQQGRQQKLIIETLNKRSRK